MDHLYLQEIADQVGYNRNYLCSLFKKDTGITIIDYLNYMRIRKACEYISYSDIDISQISSRVGFSNISHFNRTFKKCVGIPPTTFGKRYPVDLSGEPHTDAQTASGIENKIVTISEALQRLHHSAEE